MRHPTPQKYQGWGGVTLNVATPVGIIHKRACVRVTPAGVGANFSILSQCLFPLKAKHIGCELCSSDAHQGSAEELSRSI